MFTLTWSDARNKLKANSNKYFFIGYGDEEYDYQFWDVQNWKIVSRNVIFNEQVMYKDRDMTERVDSMPEVEKQDVVDLDELFDGLVPDNRQEDEESVILQEG